MEAGADGVVVEPQARRAASGRSRVKRNLENLRGPVWVIGGIVRRVGEISAEMSFVAAVGHWRVRVPVKVTMSDAVTAKARLLTVICVAAGLVEAVSETTGTMPGVGS